eukprot:NODE_35_length_31537_cov_0.293403.p23 type:complete len:109 gc:universal NODE_35_length_31537_cov_0.293403:9262-8936(-)
MTSQMSQQMNQKIQNMAMQLQNKQDELSHLNQKKEENTQIISIIEKLPKDRKCHRLIGGILVEMINEKVQNDLTKETAELKTAIDLSRTHLEKQQIEFDALRNQLTTK